MQDKVDRIYEKQRESMRQLMATSDKQVAELMKQEAAKRKERVNMYGVMAYKV